MSSKDLRMARRNLKWTQKQAAARLGVSQPYLSLLEKGKRALPEEFVKKAVRALGLPATKLPLAETPELRRADFAKQLAAVGYPGFAYLRRGWRRNPAEILIAALAQENLESRIVEALPWLLMHYSDMNREWLITQARVRNLSNRLGFVVTLAMKILQRKGEASSVACQALQALEVELQQSRLDRADEVFGQASVSPRELEWLRENRPDEAKYWHLLTDWRPEYVQYA